MANRRLKRMELPKECEDALEKAQIVEAKVSLACTVAANLSSLLAAHCFYVSVHFVTQRCCRIFPLRMNLLSRMS